MPKEKHLSPLELSSEVLEESLYTAQSEQESIEAVLSYFPFSKKKKQEERAVLLEASAPLDLMVQHTHDREEDSHEVPLDEDRDADIAVQPQERRPVEVILHSPYRDLSQIEAMQAVVKDYNQQRPSIMSNAWQWLGFLFHFFMKPFRRLEPGYFQLVSRNNTPELVAPSGELKRIGLTFNPNIESKEIGLFRQTEQKIGAYGHYVLNVPLGHYAKVSFANVNQLLGEGQHVIHDENFTTPDVYLVKQNERYIHHKDVHVFNVPPGQYAKIRIGYDYQLLPPGQHEIRSANLVFNQETGFVSKTKKHIANGNKHIFNFAKGEFGKVRIGTRYVLLGSGEHFIESANLSFDAETDTVKPTDKYIRHGNIHVLNIPKGFMALCFDNNEPKILLSGQHVIDSANFIFDSKNIVPQNTSYISHQNYHRVMVKPGHVALVSVDNKTLILEGREAPYLFRSNNFSIAKNEASYTFKQNSKHISFNGVHYLLPDQGEVAVLYDGGKLVILPNEAYPQPEAGKAFIVKSPTARFAGFLDTRVQTIEFPSKELQKERLERGEDATTSRFDKFQTAEGVNVAVRFVVTYHIEDPKLALQKLQSRQEIERHIERLVNADMGNAIGNTAFWNLLTSEQTKAQLPEEAMPGDHPPKPPVHWQDRVKNQLKEDLMEFGIVLGRLNIEETMILDESIRRQMEEQSVTATNAKAQRAILDTQNKLAKDKAMQEREMRRIEQETEAATNRLKAELATAQADLQRDLSLKQARAKADVASCEQEAQLARQIKQAKTDKTIKEQQADAELQAKQKEAQGIEAELLAKGSGKRLMAQLLEQYPRHQQLEIAKALTESLQKTDFLQVVSVLSQQQPLDVVLSMLGQLAGRFSQGLQATSSPKSPASLLTQLGQFSQAQRQGLSLVEQQQVQPVKLKSA